MKIKFVYLPFIILFSLLAACEENEVMPAFTTKHTSVTHTMASMSVSNEQIKPLAEVDVILSYVNSTAEPLKTVSLKAKVGKGAYSEIGSWDVSQDARDAVQTKTVKYQAPADGNVDVTLEMVITSHKEFPQIKRVVVKIT